MRNSEIAKWRNGEIIEKNYGKDKIIGKKDSGVEGGM